MLETSKKFTVVSSSGLSSSGVGSQFTAGGSGSYEL
jgi:hypothetical protein